MDRPTPRTGEHCEQCGVVMHLRLTSAVHTDEPGPSHRLRLHYICPECGHETDVIRPEQDRGS